ncbi:MAG: hypothetical protein QM497_04850 [Sulfurimonas sp.]
MLNTNKVVERVKEVLKDEYRTKVLDKNVAYELGMSISRLSSIKSRSLVPYDELTTFCIKYKVNTNWLFFGVGIMEMDYAKEDM